MIKNYFMNLLTIMVTALLCVTISSCSNDNEVTPEISVPVGNDNIFAKTMDFGSSASEKSFTFSSNVAWTLSLAETRSGNSCDSKSTRKYDL